MDANNGARIVLVFMCFTCISKLCVPSAASSTSDMLIIRHGRSRVRHSTEKNHIRWGLKAFDNLTFIDYDYESGNNTNGSNETMFDMNYAGNGANQSFYGNDGALGYSYFSTASNGNNTSTENAKLSSTASPNPSTNRLLNWSTAWSSATSPADAPPKKERELAKKQIMENIRKDVEVGLEYLRTHAHLLQPTAVMPSERMILQMQQQQQKQEELQNQQSKNDKPAFQGENILLKKPMNKSPFGITNSPALSKINSVHASLSSSSSLSSLSSSLSSSSKKQPSQDRAKTPSLGEINDFLDENMQGDDAKASASEQQLQQQYRLLDSKRRTHSSLTDTRDSDADNANVPPSTSVAKVSFDQEIDDKHNLNGNSFNANHLQNERTTLNLNRLSTLAAAQAKDNIAIEARPTSEIKQVPQIDADEDENGSKIESEDENKQNDGSMRAHRKFNKNSNNQFEYNKRKESLLPSSPSSLPSSQRSGAQRTYHGQYQHRHQQFVTTSVIDTNIGNQFRASDEIQIPNGMNSDHDGDSDDAILNLQDVQNDSDKTNNDDGNLNTNGTNEHSNRRNNISNDNDNGDSLDVHQFEPNSLYSSDEPNDDVDNNDEDNFPSDADERNINFDLVSDNFNDITTANRIEAIDLADLDETSRNNRLNLMKGRDVVTRFLQIVESQHLLGANCTAGTALNLGEGVVDRYAQERFRVEAEVAVNRANMLTR